MTLHNMQSKPLKRDSAAGHCFVAAQKACLFNLRTFNCCRNAKIYGHGKIFTFASTIACVQFITLSYCWSKCIPSAALQQSMQSIDSKLLYRIEQICRIPTVNEFSNSWLFVMNYHFPSLILIRLRV